MKQDKNRRKGEKREMFTVYVIYIYLFMYTFIT